MKGLADDEPHDVPGLVDMEDVCGICSDWNVETSEDDSAADMVKTGDQPKGSSRRAAKRSEQAQVMSSDPSRSRPHGNGHALSPEATEVAISHARKFPVKVIKKTVREEETVVCAVRRMSDGYYLIQKRPDKGKSAMQEKTRSRHQLTWRTVGLLAGLWELPSQILPVSKGGSTLVSRRRIAREFVAGLLGPKDGREKASIKYLGDLGSVPWVFSHLKLTMHVHGFMVEDGLGDVVVTADRTRWANAKEVEEETMGTGMRHCWKRVVAPP